MEIDRPPFVQIIRQHSRTTPELSSAREKKGWKTKQVWRRTFEARSENSWLDKDTDEEDVPKQGHMEECGCCLLLHKELLGLKKVSPAILKL
jgi:hypothetical protein